MIAMNWEPEATPKTADQLNSAPRCPIVVEAAVERGITSIVHFTRTNPGLVGILDSSAIKARRNLPDDKRLEYVYEPNAPYRGRDSRWIGYVNLSVTEINTRFFQYSQREHPDEEWVILEFSPEILADPGVVFCTTNNAYEEVVRRCEGLAGFNQMFAPVVPWGYQGSVCTRSGQQSNRTTDPQAEVLYPAALSLDHLHTITVGDEDTYDTVIGALASFPDHDPNITLKPEAFR